MIYRDEAGYYIADIDPEAAPVYARPHTFYRLRELIPLDEPEYPGEVRAYAEKERHWLAIWGSKIDGRPFVLKPGDIVRFKVKKIYPLDGYGHTAGVVRDIRVANDITVLGHIASA